MYCYTNTLQLCCSLSRFPCSVYMTFYKFFVSYLHLGIIWVYQKDPCFHPMVTPSLSNVSFARRASPASVSARMVSLEKASYLAVELSLIQWMPKTLHDSRCLIPRELWRFQYSSPSGHAGFCNQQYESLSTSLCNHCIPLEGGTPPPSPL